MKKALELSKTRHFAFSRVFLSSEDEDKTPIISETEL